MINDVEPTNLDLDAIEIEYQSCLQTYPIQTDCEKTLADWGFLIMKYVIMAQSATSPDEKHERFVQAGNLAARAARAVRTGEYK